MTMSPMHNCLTPEDLIVRGKDPGRRVFIVGGGGVGLAVAVYLLNRGEYEITIAEESGRLGRDVSPFYLWRYLKLFRERRTVLFTKASTSAWGGSDVYVTSPKGNRVVPSDSIIVSLREARQDWKESIGPCAPEVYAIGDAKRPRRLHNAIHDAYRLALTKLP